MLKLKEEFDYKSLARRLDIQLDKLIAEHERQQKVFENEIERITIEAQNKISEAKRNYADALETHYLCLMRRWRIRSPKNLRMRRWRGRRKRKSCYANAVLQCLVFTRPLTSYLVQGLHSKLSQVKRRGGVLLVSLTA